MERRMIPHQERGGIKDHDDFLFESSARQKAHKAFRRLAVDKPICECNSPKKIEMHHPDYAKWWLVGFLCQRCHIDEHFGRLRRAYRVYDLRSKDDFERP
jgi:hypothetical protein